MPDREKVLKGLYAHGYKDCKSCPYWGSGENGKSLCTQLAREALTLLKEQEPREPHYTTLTYLIEGTELIVHHPECPRCIENGLEIWDAEIKKGQAYCNRCGQAVKWND